MSFERGGTWPPHFAQNGLVTVERTEGKGTRFTLSLPRANSASS